MKLLVEKDLNELFEEILDYFDEFLIKSYFNSNRELSRALVKTKLYHRIKADYHEEYLYIEENILYYKDEEFKKKLHKILDR